MRSRCFSYPFATAKLSDRELSHGLTREHAHCTAAIASCLGISQNISSMSFSRSTLELVFAHRHISARAWSLTPRSG